MTKQAISNRMNWIILIVAGLCETGFTYCLGRAKYVTGTVYPVWTGIGAVGTVIVGIFVFSEPATFWRLFFITTLTSVNCRTLEQFHNMDFREMRRWAPATLRRREHRHIRIVISLCGMCRSKPCLAGAFGAGFATWRSA